MMKHTKGPWDYADFTNPMEVTERKTFIPICQLGSEQCDVDELNEDEYKEMRANARLIAAAPDLLEALQELLSVPGLVDGLPLHIYDMAYYAIQKATGEDD